MNTTASDVPVLVRSETTSSERRIAPSWTIAELKGRLEPITGIPASCQRLSLKIGSQPAQALEAADEDSTQIGAWPLQAYAELQVGGPAHTAEQHIHASNFLGRALLLPDSLLSNMTSVRLTCCMWMPSTLR